MSFEYAEIIESLAPIAASSASKVDRGEFPQEMIDALGDAGLLGLVSAKEVGGQGLGLAEAAAVVERLARDCASTAMIVCMHYAATAVIEQHGPEAIRRAIAKGDHLTTLAFSEPGSRSQFWASLNTAAVEGDNVRITGKKSFVTSAH